MRHQSCLEDESSCSSLGSIRGGSHVEGHEEEERDEVAEMARLMKSETGEVETWRTVLYVFIISMAIGLVGATHAILKRGGEADEEQSLSTYARFVGESMNEWMQRVDDTFQSTSDSLASMAMVLGEEWPMVTVPQFETIEAKPLLDLPGFESIYVAPLVAADSLTEYLLYATNNYESWVAEAHRTPNSDSFHPATSVFSPVGYKNFVSVTIAPDSPVSEPVSDRAVYWPIWHHSPPPSNYSLVNVNLYDMKDLGVQIETALKTDIALSPVVDVEHGGLFSYIVHSVRKQGSGSPVTAMLAGKFNWFEVLRVMFPLVDVPVYVVLDDSCGQGSWTFSLNDADLSICDECAAFIVDEKGIQVDWFDGFQGLSGDGEDCVYGVTMYLAGEGSFSSGTTYTPTIFAISFGGVFFFMILLFVTYDFSVQRRNRAVMENAARSNAIVSAIFPGTIRDRLIGTKQDTSLNTGTSKDDIRPLADLFLETTIVFADIAGFTSWSSVREPTQVFTLLEELFSSFDEIAKKRGIYKVETVGDCYVAVAGIPRKRSDHAVVSVQFAREIMVAMTRKTHELEVSLGPDTSELKLRVGCHSGPVTAGVIRGDRSRFQLFGDTVNVCSRIETTGEPDKIHVSQTTADLLLEDGKEHWLEPRADSVHAKGKGILTTYWIRSETEEFSASRSTDLVPQIVDNRTRNIDWAVAMLLQLIRQVVAGRSIRVQTRTKCQRQPKTDETQSLSYQERIPMEELQEIIKLPPSSIVETKNKQNPDDIVNEKVIGQLHQFVTGIADMYQSNPFHCFEHACHVTMSVIKLMKRIVAPALELDKHGERSIASKLHDHTYGIATDPMIQLACAFSALIHDVDHQGVSNAQLAKEQPHLAAKYKNSLAEQNSLVLSLELFMQPAFTDLRTTLCPFEADWYRFRALVTNAVLATDIVDPELKRLRNLRWEQAFIDEKGGDPDATRNRKATIVIEHLIQASDVSHTMQHWQIYRKWNERFFQECYAAFIAGRAKEDPSLSWYKGEMGFFDFYIIPLTKKLKDCGVFGKSSDEYLEYALQNRNEWETKGKNIVEEMKRKMTEKYSQDLASPSLKKAPAA